MAAYVCKYLGMDYIRNAAVCDEESQFMLQRKTVGTVPSFRQQGNDNVGRIGEPEWYKGHMTKSGHSV